MKLLAAGILCLAGLAQAGGVWRCGPEGRIYSDRPCADGRSVDVADARSAEQRQAALALAADQRRLAERWTQERLQREAAAAAAAGRLMPTPAGPRVTGSKASKPAPKPSKRPPAPDAADGTWRAVAPASPRTKG